MGDGLRHAGTRRGNDTGAKNAVVLVSGGLDSAVTLALARSRGRECFALSFDYGQKHGVELVCAARLAKALGAVKHEVVKMEIGRLGGSALTDAGIAVPGAREGMGGGGSGAGIPVTYVPARNMVFLSVAIGWAEVVGAGEVHIGVNAVDYSGYPDCRDGFVRAFEEAARQGTRAGVEGRGVRIVTPLARMSKAEIVRAGAGAGVDFSMTSSCYRARPARAGETEREVEIVACGECESCVIRERGFREAGVVDPVRAARCENGKRSGARDG